MFHSIATWAKSRVDRSAPRLLARAAFCVCVLAATPLQADPGAGHQPAKLLDWQAPEVTSGAVAPTLVLRLLVAPDGAVKQAEVPTKRDGLAAADGAIEVEVAATEHPLATNTTSDGRKAKRRVDVLV